MSIKLNEVLNISKDEYKDWTICLNNANAEGYYSFSSEEANKRLLEHISWHKFYGAKQAFRRIDTKYCIEFQRLDKDNRWEEWLFLGAYEVGPVIDNGYGYNYQLTPLKRFDNFKEKLIIRYKKVQGPKQVKLRIEYLETIEVVKILEKKYIQVNRQFEGYDHVSLPFKELKTIIDSNVDNWRELLSNINAIYVITDTSNGKLYIGSTYGYQGVWQRWSTYANTNGTGKNKELEELVKNDPDYAIKNFKFTILETFLNTNDNNDYIREREVYWKEVFDTKDNGYNDNY